MITKPAQAAFGRHEEESGSLLAKAQSLVSQAFERLSRETGDRQAIWELHQLDDRALRDIGIHRCDIEAQVRRRK
jgi:uncharacterized protein YjiS (DUF1127 family)